MKLKIIYFCLVLISIAIPNQLLLAQKSSESFTLKLSSKKAMPKATIKDAEWIAGNWKGKLFGGTGEEIWSLPTAGTMMGMFKHVAGGKVTFYELMIIVEKSNSLVLKLKHFGKNLKAWEEKEKTINFPLVKITKTALYFDGLTFKKVDKNTIQGYIRIQEKNQTTKEIDWIYRRVMR